LNRQRNLVQQCPARLVCDRIENPLQDFASGYATATIIARLQSSLVVPPGIAFWLTPLFGIIDFPVEID